MSDNDNEVIISFIIPAYNVENWINTCLRSITSAFNSKIEVIVVDDGSKDNTGDLCDAWLSWGNGLVKVIHKSNGGVSSARNVGIESSTGKYLMFIDGDDYIGIRDERSIFDLCKLECDLIQFGFNKVGKSGEILNSNSFSYCEFNKEILISNVIMSTNYGNSIGSNFRAVWGKLFKSEIIKKNKIKFPEDLYMGEDAIFLLNYIDFITNIKFVDECIYNYRIIDTSAVNRFKSDLFVQSDLEASKISEFIKKYDASKLVSDNFSCYIWWMYFRLISNAKLASSKTTIVNNDFKRWRHKYFTIMRKHGNEEILKNKYGLKYIFASRCTTVFQFFVSVYLRVFANYIKYRHRS